LNPELRLEDRRGAPQMRREGLIASNDSKPSHCPTSP
jgi:hypothetical protein